MSWIIYQLLINHWLEQFKTINKKKEKTAFNIEILKTNGSLQKHLICLGIEAIGGELELIKILMYGKKRGYFDKYPNKVLYNIDKYKKIILETSNNECPDLIDELQNKVEMFGMYANPKLDKDYFVKLFQPPTTTEIG